MTKLKGKEMLSAFAHRSACTFDGNGCTLSCGGVTRDDRPLIGRTLIATVIFACALIIKLPGWASVCLLVLSALAAGFDIVLTAVSGCLGGNVLEPCLAVSLAGVLLFVAGKPGEGAAIFLLFQILELLLRWVLYLVHSTALYGAVPFPTGSCTVLRGEDSFSVPSDEISVGDCFILGCGEAACCDCVVTDGTGAVSVAALTGDSTPVAVGEEDTVLSGSVNLGERLICRATADSRSSAAARIAEFIKSCGGTLRVPGEKLSKSVKIVMAASAFLTVASAVVLILGTDIGASSSFNRAACALLLAAFPCAQLLAVPSIYFGCCAGETLNGVIIKSVETAERLSRAETVIFSRNGALTDNEKRVSVVKSDKMDADTLLKIAAHAMAYSTGSYAKSIIAAYGGVIYIELIQDYREFPGEGVSITVQNIPIILGTREFMEKNGVDISADTDGEVSVFMAVGGIYAGVIVLSSAVKPGAAEAVSRLREIGVENVSVAITDGEEGARRLSEAVGASKIHTGFTPEDCAELVSDAKGKSRRGSVVFAAGGAEYADAMANADVGVVIGDVKNCLDCENADMLIFERPENLARTIVSAKHARKTALACFAGVLGIKALLFVLGVFGVLAPWLVLTLDVASSVAALLLSVGFRTSGVRHNA